MNFILGEYSHNNDKLSALEVKWSMVKVKTFQQMNSLERLFGIAGLVRFAKCNRLSDCMFETVVLLKAKRELLQLSH